MAPRMVIAALPLPWPNWLPTAAPATPPATAPRPLPLPFCCTSRTPSTTPQVLHTAAGGCDGQSADDHPGRAQAGGAVRGVRGVGGHGGHSRVPFKTMRLPPRRVLLTTGQRGGTLPSGAAEV